MTYVHLHTSERLLSSTQCYVVNHLRLIRILISSHDPILLLSSRKLLLPHAIDDQVVLFKTTDNQNPNLGPAIARSDHLFVLHGWFLKHYDNQANVHPWRVMNANKKAIYFLIAYNVNATCHAILSMLETLPRSSCPIQIKTWNSAQEVLYFFGNAVEDLTENDEQHDKADGALDA